MNKTKCMLTITLSVNKYTYQKEIATEVAIIDYNLENPSFNNELNLIVTPLKKSNDVKRDELALILLERNQQALMEKLKDGPQTIKNIPCELVIGIGRETGKEYKAIDVYFTEEHHRMYFLSPSNLRSLKHRDFKCEFERRQDLYIDDQENENEETE